MILTVLITYFDDTTDLKECMAIEDLNLLTVKSIVIIREEKLT